MVNLKIKSLRPGDSELTKAKVDPMIIEENVFEEGDPVKLIGNKNQEHIREIRKGYKEDYGRNIVRVNGLIRKNLKTRINDIIKVQKVKEVGEAEEITVRPGVSRNSIIKTNKPELIKKKIEERLLDTYTHRKGTVFGLSLKVFGGRKTAFTVSDIKPKDNKQFEAYKITENTKISIEKIEKGQQPQSMKNRDKNQKSKNQEDHLIKNNEKIKSITYEDIGGLNQELEKIRDMVELPMTHPDIFEELGVSPPRGVLLHGPPGTGKTLLAKAVANETDSDFYHISGPEIISKFYGESEEQLREIFEKAEQNSPSIIFIDEIDSIAPGREESTGEVEKRVVSQLLSLMDGLEERGKVVVIGATNRLDSIDNALRRGGRFDREIEIGVPNKKERKEILQIHTRGMPLDDVDLDELSKNTHGFVGADLENLTKEAAMNVLDEIKEELDYDKQIDDEVYEKLTIDIDDFKEALNNVEPSAMREFFIETPEVSYEDIGGLGDVQQKLVESIEWPVERPDLFKKGGIEPPKGTLLYGPPGTGKTLLAKAVANESDSNFISVKGPELLNKYVGESEKGVRDIFKKARQNSPCIIFFDEIDAIAKTRENDNGENVTERVVSQLLTELDGIESLEDVKVIATTNRPDLIDQALLRPGRFDNIVKVTIPDEITRREILEIHTKDTPVSKDLDYDWLAEETEGYTGSDIESLCKNATMRAIRRSYNKDVELNVSMEDFKEACEEISSSVSEDTVEMYEKIEDSLNKREEQQKNKKTTKGFN